MQVQHHGVNMPFPGHLWWVPGGHCMRGPHCQSLELLSKHSEPSSELSLEL